MATPNKKALLVGINEFQSVSGLQGCVSDVQKYQRLLRTQFGFADDHIRILTDKDAVRNKVMEQLDWLVDDAKPGDTLVFMVASHGSHVKDLNGDEADGVDEIVCLWDMDFDDPDSYLLDDDIHAFTQRLNGAALTIIFDTCHSGTANRLLRNPVARSLTKVKQLRARYLPPPADVVMQLSKVGTRAAFADRDDTGALNHVFLSGCKADQTSADAQIEGQPHGAFSYYLCKAVEKSPKGDLRAIISEVRAALAKANFAQEPQLEPDSLQGPLFGPNPGKGASPEQPPRVKPSQSPATTGSAGIAPDVGREILRVLQEIRDNQRMSRGGDVADAVGKRAIVYIHGICKHDEHFADGWWDALSPHLPVDLRAQLQNERHPVVWSDLVTPTRAILPTGVSTRAVQQQLRHEAEFSQHLRDSIEDRAHREALHDLPDERDVGPPTPRNVDFDRGLVEASGLNCIDDFTKYLLRDSVRRAVQQRFFDKLMPLLRAGYSIEVMSHSWGTVVAYEALRQLDDHTFPGRVSRFFTFGSALSFKMIKSQLQTGDFVRPACVGRWVNLDARRDFVGGSLRSLGYGADEEYLNLDPVGCAVFRTNPWCPHSSYFHQENIAVNRDIVARLLK